MTKPSGKRSQRKWDKMGMMTCLYLNIWPVSWSSPAAGAMRMYGVVSWVTIIAAKAKEDFQVSMHEGKKSQTEARPAKRILVNSLLSELLTKKPKKLPQVPFYLQLLVWLFCKLISFRMWLSFRKRTKAHYLHKMHLRNWRLFGSASHSTGLSKWKLTAYSSYPKY